MPKGPDPRKSPAPEAEVPRFIRSGAAEFNARRFWHAHEAWEEAWHSMRASGHVGSAGFLHGFILCAAALENATRGKEAGFKRQFAEGLFLLREHLSASSSVGFARPRELLDSLSHLYVDACRRVDWGVWNASGWRPPILEVA